MNLLRLRSSSSGIGLSPPLLLLLLPQLLLLPCCEASFWELWWEPSYEPLMDPVREPSREFPPPESPSLLALPRLDLELELDEEEDDEALVVWPPTDVLLEEPPWM